MDRNPPRISVVLSIFGGASIIASILFLGGSFYVENEIGRAFCFGAFFSGLLGAIVLFGFAKIIDMLDVIRQQGRSEAGTDRGGGAEPESRGSSPRRFSASQPQ